LRELLSIFARSVGVSTSRLLGVGVVVAALVIVATAAAKNFGPGDLRVCGADRCTAVTDTDVLPLLGSFYYGGPQPKAAPRPRLRSPYFELRFRNGYVTGIVATGKLDAFLSYGVYLERFRRGTWYRIPPRIAAEFRALGVPLTPFRLSRAALAKSR
jgi:hypothetical protein